MNTRRQLLTAALVCATLSTPIALSAAAGALELWGTDIDARFDGQTGEYLGPLMEDGPAMVGRGMDIGPDGNLYVFGDDNIFGNARVQRYDPVTHEYIDTFVAVGSGGINWAGGLAFGPDGNLYAGVGYPMDAVVRFDGQTGEFLDVFASDELNNPRGMVFGPDGNLYVASEMTDSVLRYDGQTGELIDIFATNELLLGAEDLEFGPDGNLYVTSAQTRAAPWYGAVMQFDGTTGDYMGFFVEPGAGNLVIPSGMTFGPDGNLYVGDGGGQIRRYDGVTGAWIDLFADYGASGATDLMFIPEPGSLALLLVGAGAVLRRRR